MNRCQTCKSKGFESSVLGTDRCSFCDGTEGGVIVRDYGIRSVPCELCGIPTPMLGTKRCDRCYELESRIKRDPELAQRILQTLKEKA